MNQTHDLPRRPHAVILIPIQKHLTPPLPTHQRLHLGKLPRHALPLDARRLLRDLVLKQPTRIPPPPQHKLRIGLLRQDDAPLDIRVDRRLHRAHEARPHVHPRGPQLQRRGQAVPVGEAARRDKRRGDVLARPTEEDEVGDVGFADVARALEAVDGEEVDAELGGGFRVADRRALVEHRAPRLLEHLDDGAGAVACGFDDADALVDDGLRVAGVVGRVDGREEGEVDAEGVLGHGAAAADFLAECVGGGLC